MYIADPGVIYRYIWCPFDKSIRLHSLRRREIRKVGNEWWVRYESQCRGIAPWPVVKTRRKRDTDCEEKYERWMPAVQWNVLCVVDACAA